ncbi:NHLP family bacteriocin export ABC transporter peptidase/permease/ATPase subunit [Segnochrobactrum spirostomi]|nr:NHLP family bacteriocin export ABC transporter peptidase/permease/ATPase subunit [Segnochrobactrum spirostomi]
MTATRRAARARTPTILQMEAVECGAACLAMVLAHFGRWIPLEELRIACGVSRDGSNALNVVKAARGYGLEAQGLKVDIDGLAGLSMPLVLYWEFNHFVVLEGIGKDIAYLNDPALGRRTVTLAELSDSFTGVALSFAPGPNFAKGGRRPSLVAGLRRRLQGSRAAFAFITLATLLLVLPGIVIPAISKIYIDKFLVDGQDGWVRPLVVSFVAAGAMSLVLTWLQQHFLMRLQIKLAVVMTGRMLWHLLSLPVEYFTQRFAGDLASRLQSNARLARTLSSDLAINLVGIVTLVLYGAIMIAYSAPLAGLAIGFAVVNLSLMRFVWLRLDNATQLLAQSSARQSSVAMSGLAAIETIKAEGAEGDLFSRWAGYQSRFVSLSQEIGRDTRLLGVMPGFLTSIGNLAVLGYGATQVMEGRLSIGDLVAFQALAASFNGPIARLVGLGAVLQTARADLQRIEDVMSYRSPDAESAPRPVRPATAPAEARLSGHLELRDITFGYSRLAAPLIEGLSLTVPPGARVAVVGASGSGKSTLVKLAAGLYRPWQGEILLDGRPLDAIDRAVLTNSVAAVDQDITLFADSIRNNMTLWDPTIEDMAVEAALEDACLRELVRQREAGIGSMVAEAGRNLSGGERQRLEIARALVRSPSLLLLDEATSALDPVTELAIDSNIRRRGCACLIVAHRLSTIRDCDEIIVLERGRIVQRGTHDSLRHADGAYARLIATE